MSIALIVLLMVFQETAELGKASYYSDKLVGKPMAGGGVYQKEAFTAAHRTLPFGTKVRVTHLATESTVEVVITDRGPFIKGRIIDLSRAAAEQLGIIIQGVAQVKVEVLKEE